MARINRKEKFVITVPANKPTTGAPIGPMIGQRGLSSIDFSKKILEITSKYRDDIPSIINITVMRSKQFDIKLKGIPLGYLINNILLSNTINDNKLSIRNIYILSKFLYTLNSSFNKYSEQKSIMKQIISSAKSHNITIIK